MKWILFFMILSGIFLKCGSDVPVEPVYRLDTFLEPHDAAFGEYRIYLTDLQPYPQDGKEIDPANYIATLEVEINRRRK